MRKRISKQGVTVNAIAGTHVVFFGFDLSAAKRKGCLGFSIHRTDLTETEAYFLKGTKTFEETDPGLALGGKVSSDKHPFQSFQWADFTAKPAHDYVYTVVPLYGSATELEQGTAIEIEITTETEIAGTHSVFFNRGAISSQEYARRFGATRSPEEVGQPAYDWLSRGLLEAFKGFLARAKDSSFQLYAAIYEFQWPDALASFKAAHDAGAAVHVIFDGIPGDGPKKKNEAAIKAAKIKALCSPRTAGKLMHNKFVVLTRRDKPVAVWTGSTNLTENGLFGHLNVGHLVEDAAIADEYLTYWHELKKDPATRELREFNEQNDPREQANADCQVVFSPRRPEPKSELGPNGEGHTVLDWYAELAAGAQRGLFMTFAFGMAQQFKDLYEQDDGVFRCALLEKEGNGAGLAQGKLDIRRIRKLPNVVIAVANNLKMNELDRWVAERRSLSAEDNVHWIHTKFMLVDPLGPAPLVITGSANFSKASTDTNEENMLLIRDDKRVADIYFTEYMRLFATYAFREAVAIAHQKKQPFVTKFLNPTDQWQVRYFKKGQDSLRRVYYSGS